MRRSFHHRSSSSTSAAGRGRSNASPEGPVRAPFGARTVRGVHPIVTRLRADLAAGADPSAAVEMQRYMKSPMPFRGVAKPARERLLKVAVAAHPLADAVALDEVVRELWDGAEFREERYLALSLTGHRPYARWLDPSWVPLLRHWIVPGAWWDVTDEIASRRVGPVLRSRP